MLDLTLPTTGQVFGDSQTEQLEIFKKYGTKAAISDFAIAKGGSVSNYDYAKEEVLENRTGCYLTQTRRNDPNQVWKIYFDGAGNYVCVNSRHVGFRLVLPFSSISRICSNLERNKYGNLEVEYGEYPQKACSKELQIELESLYKQNKLISTGKTYTTDSRRGIEYGKEFSLIDNIEYEYNGKRYVRIIIDSCYFRTGFKLSNGEKYKDGDYVWIEVKPMKWLVDEKTDFTITKNIILDGIYFKQYGSYDGNFKNTDIKKFFDKYLSKEILPSKLYPQDTIKEIIETINKIKKQISELKKLKDELKSSKQTSTNGIQKTK